MMSNCYVAGAHGYFSPANFELELAKLEDRLMILQAALQTPYDDVFVAQKREILHQQGISLLTIRVEPEDMLIH